MLIVLLYCRSRRETKLNTPPENMDVQYVWTGRCFKNRGVLLFVPRLLPLSLLVKAFSLMPSVKGQRFRLSAALPPVIHASSRALVAPSRLHVTKLKPCSELVVQRAHSGPRGYK